MPRFAMAMSGKRIFYGLSSPADGKENNVVSISSRRQRRPTNISTKTLGTKRVLVVGADNTTYRIIEEFSSHAKALTFSTTTSDDALDQIESTGYKLVIMVNHPPKVDALNVIKLFRFLNTRSTSKFLILHDDPDWNLAVRMYDMNISDIDAHLVMPFDPVELKKLLNTLLA
ncbi:MAG: hypothetical protein ACYC9J_06885 [Sulfuricaulis sp.]